MSVKVHVEPPTATCGEDWPTRLQLMNLVKEESLAELKALSSDGVAGLARRLGADPQDGLPEEPADFERRVEVFGGNWFAEKKLHAYWEFIWDALHDKILLLLLAIGTIELILKMALKPEERSEAWIEPVAIYITVAIIVNVQSILDYNRERLFESLSKKLAASNLRFVVRGGKQMSLTDNQIVVGDVLAFNSHLAATIPTDGILISGEGVKMDESALTGEPEPICKNADHPFIISGTTVNAGQGKMLVVAVGENSVSGQIKKAVYEEEDPEQSPLFQKLDRMASAVGRFGTLVAFVVFVARCVMGFAVNKRPGIEVIDYLLLSLGILAVAIPEGLPLALTISLAFSSNKMSNQNNLVKTLDSCETMGSVTTICTDKTGTLTANRMTVRSAYIGGVMFEADSHSAVGPRVKEEPKLCQHIKELTGHLISVCTMDESQIVPPEPGATEPKFLGNPTECALLRFAEDCGFDYRVIRQETEGRMESTRSEGSAKAFSSARKMMSWAVPRKEGGYRVFAKGASEIILGRVVNQMTATGEIRDMTEADRERITDEVISCFANQAFRTIGLAYRDMEEFPDETLDDEILNTDGSRAFACETRFTLIGVVGIADPLRPEVKGAIQQCYRAGIDVRMVTGDNLATAIAIARGAGILDTSLHFDSNGKIKPFRAMEGREFRKRVHKYTSEGEALFQQDAFDTIWPYLRVLARSSPEDKLTLAKGLNGSRLYTNTDQVRQIRQDDGIIIFPDQQVVAMTGDGTNDAPALKAADVGFAMGISGTQIAKDAANIILLDDNFASIVTAAKWGRNVFDSIQKFLQFQLTVNVAILVILLIVAFTDATPPLTLLHLLWLNLIMDSLASIALASEPPTDAQLTRPPVNRSDFIISEHMWYNMLGQALYQVIVVLVLLYKGKNLPGCEGETGPDSKHYTMIFNVFVLMQLFNEYNSRFLLGEFNIFKGLFDNRTFLAISLVTFIMQAIMAQFGSTVLHLHPDGLDGVQWLICLALGAGPLVWQPVINAVKRLTDLARKSRVGNRGSSRSKSLLQVEKGSNLGSQRTSIKLDRKMSDVGRRRGSSGVAKQAW